MKCFYDPTLDAIGTCKSCGKGLSIEYAVDLGKGLACKGHCEDEVKKLIVLIDKNVSLSGASENIVRGTGKTVFATSLFFLAAGGAFLAIGISNKFDTFPMVLGVIFLVYGIFSILRAKSISASIKK